MKNNLIRKLYILLNYSRLSYFKLRYQTYRLKYKIHPSFMFNGVDIEFYGDGEIIIGAGSYIGNRSVIASVRGQKVDIGENCSISHNVRFYTSNRNPMDIISCKKEISHLYGNIEIGSNCWIGANVFINQGVHIGKNVVVGANSVVTKNFPDQVVIAGSPAKIIRKIGN